MHHVLMCPVVFPSDLNVANLIMECRQETDNCLTNMARTGVDICC